MLAVSFEDFVLETTEGPAQNAGPSVSLKGPEGGGPAPS